MEQKIVSAAEMEREAASYCQGNTEIFVISAFAVFIPNTKSSGKDHVNNGKFSTKSISQSLTFALNCQCYMNHCNIDKP